MVGLTSSRRGETGDECVLLPWDMDGDGGCRLSISLVTWKLLYDLGVFICGMSRGDFTV